jgi:hypothetical protein
MCVLGCPKEQSKLSCKISTMSGRRSDEGSELFGFRELLGRWWMLGRCVFF